MKNQIIKDSIKIGLLIAAILFLFVVAIPFVVSNEFYATILPLIAK
jgi:hypothetical protein